MASVDPRFLTCLRDVLYNFHYQSGAGNDYCKGLFNGVVSTLMACQNLTFQQALAIAVDNLPTESRPLEGCTIPGPWVSDTRRMFQEKERAILRGDLQKEMSNGS